MLLTLTYYSVPQARNSNLKHRPIGLGLMGFQDALYELGLDYSSKEAVCLCRYLHGIDQLLCHHGIQ